MARHPIFWLLTISVNDIWKLWWHFQVKFETKHMHKVLGVLKMRLMRGSEIKDTADATRACEKNSCWTADLALWYVETITAFPEACQSIAQFYKQAKDWGCWQISQMKIIMPLLLRKEHFSYHKTFEQRAHLGNIRMRYSMLQRLKNVKNSSHYPRTFCSS